MIPIFGRLSPERETMMIRPQPLLYALSIFSLTLTSQAQINVLTGQYDNSRSSANLSETWLNTQNVNTASFGKLFSRTVDGAIYAQPLYASNVTIPGVGVRNVLYVGTMHNSVYAFDADNASLPAYWQVNLGSSFPNAGTGHNNPPYNIYGELGILSAPVVDLSTQTIYLAAHVIVSNAMTVQLHALALGTGAEKFSGPVTVQASVPGAGAGSVNGTLNLVYSTSQDILQIQRPALLLLNGAVYLAFGGYSNDLPPYHGWVIGYNASNLQVQTSVFNTTPNDNGAAIWQSGGGPAADANGNIYVATGNGGYDGATNFGESVIKLSTTGGPLTILDWFTPSDFTGLNSYDLDIATGGPHLLPGNIVLAGGKEGAVYLANETALGHEETGDMQILQTFQATQKPCPDLYCPGFPNPRITSIAVWNRATPLVYIWGGSDVLRVYSLSGGLLDTTPASTSTASSTFDGGNMAISANGAASGSGILWATTSSDSPNTTAVAGQLHAFNAENAAQELWNSTMNATQDNLGLLAKFVAPVVANGKVYAATLSNQVSAYGLPCGSDLTGLVNVVRSGFRYNSSNGHFLQTVTATNISGAQIAGPLTIAVQSLSANATLSSPAGSTACGAGGAYAAFPLTAPYLAAGGSVTVTLDFVNPSRGGITYTAAVARGGLYR